MATFVSNYKQLRIILRSAYVRRDGLNQTLIPGIAVQFTNGSCQVQDPETLDLLRAHPRYGIHFMEEGVTLSEPEGMKAPVAVMEDLPPVVKPKVKKPKVKVAPDVDIRSKK